MEFEKLLEKLSERINKLGIITRVWDDQDTTTIIKNIEEYLLPKESITERMEQYSNVEKFKENPSVRFYYLHIPIDIIDIVYSPIEMVEYADKNQNRLPIKEIGIIGHKVVESNDATALSKFIAKIKKVSRSVYVDAVLTKNDPIFMVEVIDGIKGENFERLHNAIINSKNPSAIYRFSQVKGANMVAIINALKESESVDYLYKLTEQKNKYEKHALSIEQRQEINMYIIETVSKMELNKVIKYTNKFYKEYADAIAEKYLNKCNDPKERILYALTTGYGREEATKNVAESGDVKLICDVLATLASNERNQNLYTKNIDIDELVKGLVNSNIEDLQNYRDRVLKVLTKIVPRLKDKENISKLYSILDGECVIDNAEKE